MHVGWAVASVCLFWTLIGPFPVCLLKKQALSLQRQLGFCSVLSPTHTGPLYFIFSSPPLLVFITEWTILYRGLNTCPAGMRAQPPSVLPVHPRLRGQTTPTPSSSFSDDTTVVGLITDNNDSAYTEVRELALWCQDSNLSLNISKTKELIIDFRNQRGSLASHLCSVSCKFT
jgi:hypothetical protein